MKDYEKTCIVCNKEYKAKRKHSETCSEACRAQKNANIRALRMVSPAIEKAKPAIIAEAKPAIIAEVMAEVNKAIEEVKRKIHKQYMVNVDLSKEAGRYSRGRELFFDELDSRFRGMVIDGTHFYEGPTR